MRTDVHSKNKLLLSELSLGINSKQIIIAEKINKQNCFFLSYFKSHKNKSLRNSRKIYAEVEKLQSFDVCEQTMSRKRNFYGIILSTFQRTSNAINVKVARLVRNTIIIN